MRQVGGSGNGRSLGSALENRYVLAVACLGLALASFLVVWVVGSGGDGVNVEADQASATTAPESEAAGPQPLVAADPEVIVIGPDAGGETETSPSLDSDDASSSSTESSSSTAAPDGEATTSVPGSGPSSETTTSTSGPTSTTRSSPSSTQPRGDGPPPVEHRGVERVTVSAPGSNLAALVASKPAGTSFYFPNGRYRFGDVQPKDGMTFIGQSTDGVVVDGNGFGSAFYGTARDVSIANMTLRDFNGNSGEPKRQEQAPIRGTRAIWASDRGEMAVGWIVENIVSEGGYASGIFLGDHFVVRNSVFRNNGVTGIAADSIVGGNISGNTIYGNGAHQATGVYVNGGGIKMTQAGTAADPVVVRGNEVYANTKSGVWCDLGCRGFHVIDNNIHDHEGAGVVLELSANVRIAGNTLTNNSNWTDYNHNFNSGSIKIAETSNVTVENNRVTGAPSGIVVHHAQRPAPGEESIIRLDRYPTLNFDTFDVTVRNNRFADIQNIGLSTGTTGRIDRPGTITFSGNTYDNPGAITFHWNNKQRQTYAQWQGSGRQ